MAEGARNLQIGCEVKTVWGWGVLQRVDADTSRLIVELDWSTTLSTKNQTLLYTCATEIIACSFCAIGTCVLTKYGVGVLVDFRRNDGIHVVKMWQMHTEGSALAYLQKEDIRQISCGSVGFPVYTPFGSGHIIRYRESCDTYDVRLDYGLCHFVGAKQFVCWEARVLPAVSKLMKLIAPNLQLVQNKLAGFSALYENIRKGTLSIEDAFKELTSVANHEELAKSVRNQWESNRVKVADKLMEIKTRMIQMISEANIEDLTSTGTKLIESKVTLESGRKQIESLLSSMYQVDIVDKGASYLNELELKKKLSDFYESAKSDPALGQLSQHLDNAYANLKVSFDEAKDFFLNSKSGKVLEAGGEKLKSRMENLVVSFQKRAQEGAKANGGSVDTSNPAETNSLNRMAAAFTKKITSAEGQNVMQALKGKLLNTVASINLDPADNDSMVGQWVSLLFSQTEEKVVNVILGDSFVKKMISMCMDASQARVFTVSHFREAIAERLTAILVTAIIAYKASEKNNNAAVIDANGSRYDYPTGLDILRIVENPYRGAVSFSSSQLQILKGKGDLDRLAASTTAFQDALGPLAKLAMKISKGEDVSLQSASAAMKASLDSESLEDVAKRLIDAGDKVVDSIESIRGLDSVQKAIAQMQALDMESTLLSSLESLEGIDAEGAVSMAENAIRDTEARDRLIEHIKTHVIDFLSAYLPTLSIPALSGTQDGIEYCISGLDMSGFKLNKEGIHVKLSDKVVNSELISFRATGINAKFVGIQWSYAQTFFPHLTGSGVAEATVTNAGIEISFKVIRVPKGSSTIFASTADLGTKVKSLADKFPGLGQHLNRVRDHFMEIDPTYEPGSISLQTLLTCSHSEECGDIWGDGSLVQDWEPVLVIAKRHLTIESLELVTDNSSFSWLYNLLAGIFSSIIKDYVCNQLELSLVDCSAQLLGMVNCLVGEYWPMIGRFIQIPAATLPVSTGADLFTLCAGNLATAGGQAVSRDFVLKFEEEGSIGLKLDIQKRSLAVPPKEDRLLVLGCVAGSQAERVVQREGLDVKIVRNALVRTVNGRILVGESKHFAIGAPLISLSPLHVIHPHSGTKGCLLRKG